jgi:hypothetical protein
VGANPWLHRIAEIRSEGAPERVAFHEEDLRRRLSRQRRGGASREPLQAAPNAVHPDSHPPGETAAPVSSAMRRLYKAEEEVLRACLEDREVAARAFGQIAPGDFLRQETLELATLIISHLEDAEWSPGAWPIESEGAQSLLGRLAADPAPIPEMEWIAKSTQLLRHHREREQIKPLTEGRTPTVEELQRIQELYLRRQKTGAG